MDDIRESIDPSISDLASRADTPVVPGTPVLDDDPDQLEKEKARKTALSTAIKTFNFKPKRGIKLLIDQGFIPSDSAADIARFLVREERLDKAQIGEFLGEGDPKNIEIMHAFVDTMDFEKRRFVAALRQFLQSFRLPGEAQKIDRFMLKFAERYNDGNPNAFANADTAYVLAYSVILLNTDLHSANVVKRMTKQDFIRNNRGINDNADLPDEYLIGIYEEIGSNEIVLKTEREAAAAAGTLPVQQPTGLASAFSNVGRDLQREAYVQQSEEIALRSEQLFKSLFRSQRRNAAKAGGAGGSGAGVKFVPATNFKHIGPTSSSTACASRACSWRRRSRASLSCRRRAKRLFPRCATRRTSTTRRRCMRRTSRPCACCWIWGTPRATTCGSRGRTSSSRSASSSACS
jgi:brefeldin A-inhibited guanine nucleotide-exchange protein